METRTDEDTTVAKTGVDAGKSEPWSGLIGKPFGWGWAMVPGGIYFVPAEAASSLSYFDFAIRKSSQVFRAGKDFDDGLSISPDGRYVLYAQNDQENSSIMLVEPFH